MNGPANSRDGRKPASQSRYTNDFDLALHEPGVPANPSDTKSPPNNSNTFAVRTGAQGKLPEHGQQKAQYPHYHRRLGMEQKPWNATVETRQPLAHGSQREQQLQAQDSGFHQAYYQNRHIHQIYGAQQSLNAESQQAYYHHRVPPHAQSQQPAQHFNPAALSTPYGSGSYPNFSGEMAATQAPATRMQHDYYHSRTPRR